MIGGSLGSFLGPLGTVVGATVGHFMVDRKAAVSKEKQVMRLLAMTAGALHEFACCNGQYTRAKDEVIRAIVTDLNASLGRPLDAANLAFLLNGPSRIDRAVVRLAAMLREHPPASACEALSWLWVVAVCDGGPSAQEENLIEVFVRHAGISPRDAQFVAGHFARRPPVGGGAGRQDRRAACDTLGVPYSASVEEIKRAYRTLSQKYHPDKHVALDPDIRALTAEKFAQIKRAYDSLCGG
ncbi:MAG: DnaJ domain-containing protein [Kiritimatiellaeota bacterium]|nr:DnaJ domain-containing protein [Kiritimatiellota bacterium]